MAVTKTIPPSDPLSFSNHHSKREMPLAGEDNGLEKIKKKPTLVQKWAARDLIFAVFMLTVHVLCLFAPFTFNRGAFVTASILYFLTGALGVTLSYHRNLAHKSFKLPKYLEYMFAYFAVHACQGDPIFWVSTHRYHHKVTDTVRDPHSPAEGIWFSHIGWIFDVNKIIQKGGNYKNVSDLTQQPYYKFLRKTVMLHPLILGIILYMVGGFPFIVWGMAVRIVMVYHITFSVNSICHIWGHQAWNTGDLSKNNWVLSVITFGESWHNNHHAFEYSARQGLEWWQIDVTWYVIKLLEYVGLATDVKLPSKAHKQRLSINAKQAPK
ncbi:hypothetical protein ACHQM5_011513 [Ranunculus cassubicifolius]